MINIQEFLMKYQNEILLVVATAIVTLVFSKLLPWIWQNLILNPFILIAKRLSRQWERRSFEIEYLGWLIEDNKYLQVRGLRMQAIVSPYLESIFIPLQATASLHVGEREEEKRKTGKTFVSANEMINNNKRIVILGDPGSGKTTLLRYLVLNYARLLRNNRYEGDIPGLIRRRLGLRLSSSLASYRGYNENPVPVYISFRTVSAKQLTKINFKIEELVFGRHLSYPKNYLNDKLRSGKCIFFLDGLDEVSGNERQKVVDWVEDLVSAYPDNKYVVTSRVVGYTNPLTNGFVVYKLEDFSDKDIESFIKQWYLAVETSTRKMLMDKNKILEQAQELIAAISENQQVRLLAVNPLLLSIIALIHRARVRLPEKRVDLYDECTIVLLGYWDQAKGLVGKLQPSQKRAVLEAVAYEMQTKMLKEITSEKLTEILEGELPKYGGSIQDTVHFLDEIKERSGLLVERGVDVFSFSHLTFQEYLAARYLARTDNGMEIVFQNIRDDQWREVILLFCGMREPSLLVNRLLEIKDDMFYTWTALAGQCVADALFVSETLRKEIPDKLIQIALSSNFSPLTVSMMKICSKIDPIALLKVIENEFRQSSNFNFSVVSDSFPLLQEFINDEFCLKLLGNEDLRLSILRTLAKQRDVSDRLFEFVLGKLPDFNEKEKLAVIDMIENNPIPIALEALAQTFMYDASDQVRSRSIKILGAQDNPRVFYLLGISVLDASGIVIDQVMDSVIGVINSNGDSTLLRYSLTSSIELLKSLRIRGTRPQSALALIGGVCLGFGLLLIRSSRLLNLHLREGRKDFIANIAWGIYRNLLGFFTALCKVLLFKIVSHDDLNFWAAYYKSIIAHSLNDPKKNEPFRDILPHLPKKYLDFLSANIFILNKDLVMIERLLDVLIEKTVILDDLWSVAKVMDHLGEIDHEFALSLASKMAKSPLLPIRGEGILTIYQLNQYANKEHLEILANTTKDESSDLRELSAWAIAEIKELQIRELILNLLGDNDVDVLRETIDTVGRIGLPEYIDEIRPFLTHENNDVRDAAYNTLYNISKINKISIAPA